MNADQGILALPLYDEHHRALARWLGDWCAENAALWQRPVADPEQTGRRILTGLGDGGWLRFLDPADKAAAPAGDYRSLCVARETLAYADDLADFAFSIQALAATPILRHGSEPQRRRWLPAMARGELAGSFAVSERAAGSDLAAVALRAERVDGGYQLTGEKAWIANAGIADVHCVIARTGQAPGPLGLTAFLVPAGTPGLLVRPVPVIAPRSFGDLVFDGCRVDDDAVLGRPGGGFVIAMELLERFRMTVGAAAVGFARRAADAAYQRTRERQVYGGRLFDLQLVKASLADIEVKLNASALLVARAAWELDHGSRTYGRHSSIAKLAATEHAQQIVDATVQLFGAAGLVADSLPERLYRQIRSLRIYEGASEVQQMIVAGALDRRRAPVRPPAAAGTGHGPTTATREEP